VIVAQATDLQQLEITTAYRVQDAVILHPDQPAALLAEDLYAEDEGVVELGRMFALSYLVRAINAERRKAHPKPEILPLFAHLELSVPQRIVTPEGKRPLLAKSTATEIRAYVKTLNSRHRDKIAGLQAVLEIMGKYITENRGITAAEVAEREVDTATRKSPTKAERP
jgi:hypothetical protein